MTVVNYRGRDELPVGRLKARLAYLERRREKLVPKLRQLNAVIRSIEAVLALGRKKP